LAHTHFEMIDQLSQLAPADGSISFARARVLNIELFDPSLVSARVRDAIDGTRLQVSNFLQARKCIRIFHVRHFT